MANTIGASVPAPVKGWNARDPLDGMDPEYAPVLDNWFPRTNYIEVRRGSDDHATGIGSGVVETLFSYRNGSTKQLLAFGNSAVYNASSSGAVGTALGTGFSNNRWQGVNFGGYGLFVNGEDTPSKYDGTTWSTTTWTGSGLTATDLNNIMVFKNRVFMAEANTANVWYGGLNSISGTVNKFALRDVHPEGGNLVAFGTLTHDGGTGPDDLCAFFLESGAVLIYSGTDISDATKWSLVGIFNIGPLVHRRGLMKIGPDLIAVTADGYIPLLNFLRLDRTQNQYALSDKISGAVNDAVRDYGSNFGWQAILHPKGTMALFNVPLIEGAQFHQHVINTQTGAWCRFTGMNAVCWTVHNDELYYGGTDGKVYKADTGLNDNGSNIQADGQTAYNYFRRKGQLKRFLMYRPVLGSDGTLPVSLGIGVDFQSEVPTFEASSVTTQGEDWDAGDWDDTPWAGGVEIQKSWQAASALGYAASMRVRTSTQAQVVRWYSCDFTYEPGAFI